MPAEDVSERTTSMQSYPTLLPSNLDYQSAHPSVIQIDPKNNDNERKEELYKESLASTSSNNDASEVRQSPKCVMTPPTVSEESPSAPQELRRSKRIVIY